MEKNKLTLEESIRPLTDEEKKEALEEFSNLGCKLIETLYETLNVMRQDPPNKLDSHMMLFQSRLGDELTGNYHDRMFELAFLNRLGLEECTEKLKKDVIDGKAIELGDVHIEDVYMSNVLSGNELQIGINFMLTENYEEKERIRKEEEKKLEEEKQKLNRKLLEE
nr:MAG TPA: hypothetical protein [Herelleviridae sp.]